MSLLLGIPITRKKQAFKQNLDKKKKRKEKKEKKKT
jgi:hypothetical protein